ncbi:hypothetical protein ACLBOM_26515 [Escherichia coli]
MSSEITTTAPHYAILPFTPIIGVLIFDGKWGPPDTHHHYSGDLYV